MYKNFPRYSVTGLLILVFVLSGCQVQLLPPTGSTMDENRAIVRSNTAVAEKDEQSDEKMVEEVVDKNTVDKNVTSEKPAKPAKRAIVSKEISSKVTSSKETGTIDIIVKTIEQPIQESVEEVVVVVVGEAAEEAGTQIITIAATATSVPLVLESVQPTAIPAAPTQVPPTATPAPPIAYVTGAPIRIHAGPGANYALHGIADQGTTFALVGQAQDCQWYQVQHPAVGTAWITSTDGNVTIYNATCPQLPLATN